MDLQRQVLPLTFDEGSFYANIVSKDEAIHVCVRSWVFLIFNIYPQLLTISKAIGMTVDKGYRQAQRIL